MRAKSNLSNPAIPFVAFLLLAQCSNTTATVRYVDVNSTNATQPPTNSCSVLRLLSACCDGSDVAVTWQSVAGVNYFVECSTNLVPPPHFRCVARNLVGQAEKTAFVDTTAAITPVRFYRVGVGN